MAMTMEEFDAILASSSGDSSMPGMGMSDDKYTRVMGAANQKRNDIYPARTRRNIESVPDGDGYIPTGDGNPHDRERRMLGYDAYEVAHPELMQDAGFVDHMERQRKRYSQEFNKPLNEVTYEDVNREGEKDKLRAAARMFGGEAGQNWEPGPILYDPTKEQIDIGSAENPLNMPLDTVEQSGTGVHGRTLGTAFNADTGSNVNEDMHDPYNALIFDGQTSRNGKSIPAFQKMEEQNMISYIRQQREMGREPSKAELEIFRTNSGVTNQSKADKLTQILQRQRANGSGDGRAMTDAKLAFGGFANIVTNAADTVVELGGKAGKKAGLWEDTEFSDSLFDSDLKMWNKKLNVNEKYSQRATAELQGAVKDGRYMDAIGSVVKNLDVHLAQSLPEMGALALKVPGLLASVNSRVKEQTAEFIKTNGREPTDKEVAGMWATNAAVLVPEQLLLVGPLKTIFNAARKGSAGLKGGFQNVGTTVGKKTGNVVKTLGFETAQEVTDQATEQYWKKGGSGDAEGVDAFSEAWERLSTGKVISKDEAIAAGIAGGVMGGVLRGGAEVVGAKQAVENSLNLRKFKGSLDNMDKYLDAVDKDFAAMSLDSDVEAAKVERKVVQDARTELKAAQRSKGSTIEALEKSDNKYVKEYVSGIKAAYVNNKATELDYGNNSVVKSFIAVESLNPESKAVAAITNKGEMDGLDIPGKINFLSGKMKDKKVRQKFISALDNDTKGKIFDKAVSTKDKNAFEKDYGSEIDTKLNTLEKGTNATIHNAGLIKKRISKSTTSPRKSGDVNVDSSSIEKTKTAGNFLQTIFGTNSSKKKIMSKLNEYDNKSLKAALDQASPQKTALINKVLDQRKKATENAGIGTAKGFADKAYNYVTDEKMSTKTPTETLQALKTIAQRTEMRDMQEVKNTEALINESFKNKSINEKQKDILMGRLAKIDNKTKKRLNKEEQDSRESKKSAQQHAEMQQKLPVSEQDKPDNREYRFQDDKGNQFSGKITFIDKNKGTIHVQHEVDGEMETVIFGGERGFQQKEVGKPTKYSGGRIHNVGETENTSEADGGSKKETYTKPTPKKIDEDNMQYGDYTIVKNPAGGFDVILDGEKVTGTNRGGLDSAYELADKHAQKEMNKRNENLKEDFEGDSEGTEEMREASQKANAEILGEFDVESMSDEEIKEMSTILNELFDC